MSADLIAAALMVGAPTAIVALYLAARRHDDAEHAAAMAAIASVLAEDQPGEVPPDGGQPGPEQLAEVIPIHARRAA